MLSQNTATFGQHYERNGMNLATLPKFLIGNRQAIQRVDDSKHALWIGLLFVLSAGFAREYDGEDLLHEPWHLLLPLGVTIVASLVLYGVLLLAMKWPIPEIGRGYLRFLTLFAMTAPLAWLYAIPAERLLSAGDSVRMNLWLLAIVSLWRVLLISRVISVIYQCRFLAAFSLVMLFGDAVALTVLRLTPLPVFSIMGGIRLSEAEEVLQATAFFVGGLGIVTLPVWLIASSIVLIRFKRSGWERRSAGEAVAVRGGVWAVAMVALLIWAVVLPFSQPEQINRGTVERMMDNGEVDQALAFMSAHDETDFPPHWDPPPRIGFGESVPNLLDVVSAILDNNSAAWVRDVYHKKLFEQSAAEWYAEEGLVNLFRMDEADLQTYIEILNRSQHGPRVAKGHTEEITLILDMNDREGGYYEITDSRRELLKSIQTLAAQHEE